MLAHEEFGTLRLASFAPEAEIHPLEDWEYLDELWVGEAIGFTEWLRLADDPDRLRSIALELAVLPEATSRAVIERLELPVALGSSADDLAASLGAPERTLRFVADRVTHEWTVGGADRYRLGGTFVDGRGLVYVTLHVLPLRGSFGP